MADSVKFTLLAVVFLFVAGFVETLQNTRFKRLEVQKKRLHRKICREEVIIQSLKQKVYKAYSETKLRERGYFPRFKKTLPQKIKVVEFVKHQQRGLPVVDGQ